MSKELNLQDLEHVTGGFAEQNSGLPTSGMEIECPRCHNRDKNAFARSALYDPKLGSVEYRCKCGCQFVCYQGEVILRENWNALCKKKGISYGF